MREDPQVRQVALSGAMRDDGDTLLATDEVCLLFGGKSRMTIYRWENDPELNFPKPLRINGRKYHRLNRLRQFQARLAEIADQRATKPAQ